MLSSILLKKIFFYKNKIVFLPRRCHAILAGDEINGATNGEKFSVYSFLLAGSTVRDATIKDYEVCLESPRGSLVSLFTIFKYHSLMKFDFLVDLTSWDKPGEKFRFSILYSFLSLSYNSRFYVLCQTREGVPLESVVDLYESSSWLERECWDMHGVYFVNHNNFLRLLTDYGFKGHPLRKDFPLSGFVELFYDDCASGVVYEPVELVQEYRNFQFKSPWAENTVISDQDDEQDDFNFDFDFYEEEQKINTNGDL